MHHVLLCAPVCSSVLLLCWPRAACSMTGPTPTLCRTCHSRSCTHDPSASRPQCSLLSSPPFHVHHWRRASFRLRLRRASARLHAARKFRPAPVHAQGSPAPLLAKDGPPAAAAKAAAAPPAGSTAAPSPPPLPPHPLPPSQQTAHLSSHPVQLLPPQSSGQLPLPQQPPHGPQPQVGGQGAAWLHAACARCCACIPPPSLCSTGLAGGMDPGGGGHRLMVCTWTALGHVGQTVYGNIHTALQDCWRVLERTSRRRGGHVRACVRSAACAPAPPGVLPCAGGHADVGTMPGLHAFAAAGAGPSPAGCEALLPARCLTRRPR